MMNGTRKRIERLQGLDRYGRQFALFGTCEHSIDGSSAEVDEDPPCLCVRIDVDLDNARNCPLHGPDSSLEYQGRQQEGDDLALYYAQNPFDDEEPAA
jgi:hypothetical protein